MPACRDPAVPACRGPAMSACRCLRCPPAGTLRCLPVDACDACRPVSRRRAAGSGSPAVGRAGAVRAVTRVPAVSALGRRRRPSVHPLLGLGTGRPSSSADPAACTARCRTAPNRGSRPVPGSRRRSSAPCLGSRRAAAPACCAVLRLRPARRSSPGVFPPANLRGATPRSRRKFADAKLPRSRPVPPTSALGGLSASPPGGGVVPRRRPSAPADPGPHNSSAGVPARATPNPAARGSTTAGGRRGASPPRMRRAGSPRLPRRVAPVRRRCGGGRPHLTRA